MLKRKNIWFFCPACDKKLVVGAEAAGYRSLCPECGKSIPIPLYSNAWPNWTKTAMLYGAQVVFLVIALSAGWWWMASHLPEDNQTVAEVRPPVTAKVTTSPATNAAVAAATPAASTSVAEQVSAEWLARHEDLQGKYNKVVAWMIENYRGKYPLPERLVNRLRIAPLTDDHDVHPDLIEVLRITPEEKAVMKDVFEYVRAHVTEAELDRALITEQKPDRITFSVPAYADVGQEIKDDLYLSLEKTLGAPRFDRMMEMTEQDLQEKFHYFGAAERTLTFEVIYPANSGDHAPYVLIRDGWVVPDGQSVRVTKVTETAISHLPKNYQAYQEWLPEEVVRFSAP